MVKVSVIIPCYNVAKYLGQCLDSVLKQTFQDFEVLCVNDGSTDNSLEIAKKYKKEDKRINIVDIENNGVGNARNVGIKGATGRYITFLDADDYIEHNMYEKIIKKMEETNVELLRCNFIKEDEEGNIIKSNNDLLALTIIRKDGLFYNKSQHKMFGCNKYNIDESEKIAVFSESSVQQEINMDFNAIGGATYNYTFYIQDVYGKYSEPCVLIVET